MAKIKLTQDKYAIVDDADFEWLNQWKWKLNWNGYACRNARADGRYVKTYMHRLINATPTGQDTDHINRNKLDNRRSNLRDATRSQNNFNMLPSVANTSGTKGVSWSKQRNSWRAYIKIAGRQVYLGRFKDKQDAINARLNAELLLCA